jgi:hypothetical protein
MEGLLPAHVSVPVALVGSGALMGVGFELARRCYKLVWDDITKTIGSLCWKFINFLKDKIYELSATPTPTPTPTPQPPTQPVQPQPTPQPQPVVVIQPQEPGNYYLTRVSTSPVKSRDLNGPTHLIYSPHEARRYFFKEFNNDERLMIVEKLMGIENCLTDDDTLQDAVIFYNTFEDKNEFFEILLTDVSNDPDKWLPFELVPLNDPRPSIWEGL